eukprot:s1952_g9.t1
MANTDKLSLMVKDTSQNLKESEGESRKILAHGHKIYEGCELSQSLRCAALLYLALLPNQFSDGKAAILPFSDEKFAFYTLHLASKCFPAPSGWKWA